MRMLSAANTDRNDRYYACTRMKRTARALRRMLRAREKAAWRREW